MQIKSLISIGILLVATAASGASFAQNSVVVVPLGGESPGGSEGQIQYKSGNGFDGSNWTYTDIPAFTTTTSTRHTIVQPDAFSTQASGLSFKYQDDSWKFYHSGVHLSIAEGADDASHTRRAYIEGGTGNYVQPSSRALKQNIEPLGGTLNRIEQLLPVSYNYIGVDNNTIGFVAEDLAEVMPEVVSYDEDNSPGISYSLFGPIAISAIKEQQVIIRELQSKNTELEARLAAIEAKME